MLKIVFLSFIIFLLSISAHGQSDSLILNRNIRALQQHSAKHPSEKVHLHLDRQSYSPADTIWFKAYVISGEYHELSTISGVLYAELSGGADTVLSRLTLNLDSGISNGCFILPANYKAGIYHIRAYTNYMRNEDAAYFYDQQILIAAAAVPDVVNITSPATKVTARATSVASAKPDIQFFPEGGELVEGLRSKVAVKAVKPNGTPIEMQGTITDMDGNEISTFNTEHEGMGLFPLTPQAGKKYKLKATGTDGINLTIDLPAAKTSGFTLSVNSVADSLYIKVAANEAQYKNSKGTKFYLLAQSAGKYYFAASDNLDDPIFTTRIPKSRFPSGLVQFTLFSQSGEPLNERVIFVQNADQLQLLASSAEQVYTPRQKVTITLQAKDATGRAAAGTFSVAVTDEIKVPADEHSESTIFSDLLLKSDLRGHIESPNYYFQKPDNKTRADLDLLMLTQGYRKFEWQKVLTNTNEQLAFAPQDMLSISGTVKTPGGKPVANGKVRLTAIAQQLVIDTLTDINGNFTFKNVVLPDTTKVVINAKNEKGGDNVRITINEPSYPPPVKTTVAVDQAILEKMTAITSGGDKNVQRGSLKGVIQLDEVSIKHKKNPVFEPTYSDNIKYSSNLNGPGNANQVLLGDKLIGCPTLGECLRGKLFGVTLKSGNQPYSTRAEMRHLGGARPMAIFVDGTQFGPDELNNISGDEVYSIEVLTSLSYLSIYGSNAPNGALIITRKRGSAGYQLGRPDGLITYNFKGYQKERQFYSPQYLLPNTTYGVDDRKTIYWNPNIVTDASGNTSFSYFNGDGKGTYRVVIEGIDINGALGRQVFRYQVK